MQDLDAAVCDIYAKEDQRVTQVAGFFSQAMKLFDYR